MPLQNGSKFSRSRTQKYHTKHQHSKPTPYTKLKPTSLKSTSSSKKSFKQIKFKNESLIEELDNLAAGDLLYNTTNKFTVVNNKSDDGELQSSDERLIFDIEKTLKELESFAVKE
ncbi:hypothetical protein RclHR1_00790041 [Rhizophagus clarus]|uniref:Uncharacterized protein n=1 Tax=Rhizophagus clarus TaxID=94130 RepID=A0A2Z6S0S0_9GLOM|nr:hypothetical protein RclHR1_00790041 [Rhizophagus clarus]GES90696.1 hypothetical protein RCL_jg14276.t1 [Rhizophagus clarus]